MEERQHQIDVLFKKHDESEPEFYAVAPGRVNIIGEHVDYCGYAVLPMAIQQNIIIGIRRNNQGKIIFRNTNPVFEDYSCNVDNIEISSIKPRWYHYAMCGIRGIVENFDLASTVGMTMIFDGNVPCNAGLSSSSALVCASALATLHANSLQMEKAELANLAASCEKYIGTQGGGMDQAISFLAEKGKAKLIEFNPLRDTNVCIPAGATFVIINSCVEINKASTSNYNERVVECRISSQILAKTSGLDWRTFRKLGDVHAALNVSLEEMSQRVQDTFQVEPYTRSNICAILGLTDEEFVSECLTANTTQKQHFKLYHRAKHVYEEARRVYKFKEACDSPNEDCMHELGQLMNASHDSLRDQYECSHPEVDELVNICRQAGALGSRITGAGWGGCTVSLVPESKVQNFKDEVAEKFFLVNNSRQDRMANAIFVSESADGAKIITK